jgi:inner membrane protein
MQGRTHALIGAAAGLLLAVQVAAPAESTAMFVAAGALGGLLPDVDHPQSSINQKLPFIRLFTFWLPHRTLTHSVFAISMGQQWALDMPYMSRRICSPGQAFRSFVRLVIFAGICSHAGLG